MHVAYDGRVANVAELRDGSVFLADLDGGPVVRAVKAFTSTRPASTAGKVVTVSPSGTGTKGNPAPTSRTSSAGRRWST